MIRSEQHQEDGVDAENDEDDDSHMNDDDHNRFAFTTSKPIEDTLVKNNSSEDELKIQDDASDSHKHNTVVVTWIACEVH